MQFSFAIAAAALVACVAAHKNDTAPVFVTEVVTAYTTYCPSPTQITHGTNTWTVTEATTLTITDCPCTITKSIVPTVTPPAPPANNVTVPVVVPSVSASKTAPVEPSIATPITTFTGAANNLQAGAGLAAAFGLAAYIL